MLGNPVMVTTQGLTILLLVLCITYITQTAPLNISFPDFQNQFTKQISESLKEVKWGCTKETKCYKNIDLITKTVGNGTTNIKWGRCKRGTECHYLKKLLKILLESLGMKNPPFMKKKNGNSRKNHKAGK